MIKVLEDKSIYPDLHKRVFGTNGVQPPEVVNIVENKDGEVAGFIAGHWDLDGTFYIEFAGVLPEFRLKGWMRYYRKLLHPCVDYLTATANDNVVAMKTLLSTGFTPIGGRMHNEKYHIEWIRRGMKNG